MAQAKKPNANVRSLPHPLEDDTLKLVSEHIVGFNEKDLKVIREVVTAAIKRIADARREKMPAKNSMVKITGGEKRWVGKKGRVVGVQKTRAYVELENDEGLAYVSFEHLSKEGK